MDIALVAHYPWHLPQMNSLPLSIKKIMSIRRIIRWYNFFDGAVYLRFSGGRKSKVLKNLIDNIFDDIPSVMAIDPAENQIKSNDIIFVKSLHTYEKCEKRMPYIGSIICENEYLKKIWHEYGCNNFSSPHPISMPLSFWNINDINEYNNEISI